MRYLLPLLLTSLIFPTLSLATNQADYDVWFCQYTGGSNCTGNADYNSDDKVDGIDYVIWRSRFGESTPTSCTDTDSGIDKDTKGTATGTAGCTSVDSCWDSNTLMEAYCGTDNSCQGIAIDCRTSGGTCQNGACVTPTPTPTPIAIPADFNHDGLVDNADLTVWLQQYDAGQTDLVSYVTWWKAMYASP